MGHRGNAPLTFNIFIYHKDVGLPQCVSVGGLGILHGQQVKLISSVVHRLELSLNCICPQVLKKIEVDQEQ